MSAPRDIRKRLEIAMKEIKTVLEGLDRLFLELNRCKSDLSVAVNSKKADFYRCTCQWLREKGEKCKNPTCTQFGGTP